MGHTSASHLPQSQEAPTQRLSPPPQRRHGRVYQVRACPQCWAEIYSLLQSSQVLGDAFPAPDSALLSSLVLGESMTEKHNRGLRRAEGGEGCRGEVTEGDERTASVTWEHADVTCTKASSRKTGSLGRRPWESKGDRKLGFAPGAGHLRAVTLDPGCEPTAGDARGAAPVPAATLPGGRGPRAEPGHGRA